jgi:asparagine synthase (glutamine-hydrolysing)
MILNASGWPHKTIGNITYFSPNTRILENIIKNTGHAFWHTTYTEFACIMFNKSDQTIQAVRDHVGLEPLFYYFENKQFIFGSNLPDMIQALGFKPELNQNQLEKILLSACGERGHYSNNTLYQDIHRVEPGNRLNRVTVKCGVWH